LQTAVTKKKATTSKSKKQALSEVDTNTEGRRVKFAEESQHVEYEKEEPTIHNINIVTSVAPLDIVKIERSDYKKIGPQSPRSAKHFAYTLHALEDDYIEEGFETRDMTIGELKRELSHRKLATTGKRCLITFLRS
jgi:hypothetical protein